MAGTFVEMLEEIRPYLPAQAPLKDFIFQNPLRAFQKEKFFDAVMHASEVFGYKTLLSLQEYRERYQQGLILEKVLDKTLERTKPGEEKCWKEKLLIQEYLRRETPRIGKVRNAWKNAYKLDMDSLVHPVLFRMVCSYLDQGISIWNFPEHQPGFLESLREMERMSFSSFFKTSRPSKILKEGKLSIETLLSMVVGPSDLHSSYLYDQLFAHQGWSGLVSVLETRPDVLLDSRPISLHDFIYLELLLELDVMDKLYKQWKPLGEKIRLEPTALFEHLHHTELDEVLHVWQEAMEWSYYDQVLAGIQLTKPNQHIERHASPSFQAMFCIDDRECSFRRYLEAEDPSCETFGTPGFFSVEFYYKPKNGQHVIKLCPAPVQPSVVIEELSNTKDAKRDLHFNKRSHGLFGGYLTSQTLGFWSAFKLVSGIFKPTMDRTTASSFMHMNQVAELSIENKNPQDSYLGYRIGFTLEEMITRVESQLRSIGLTKDFAPLIYVVGHGGSSANNPFYTTMDCGACSCRPGSVNAKVFSYMANKPEVRAALVGKGILIPDATQFVGGIHDTTRDDIMFFEEEMLSSENAKLHQKNRKHFERALNNNAKERSRRFEMIDTRQSPEAIHQQVQIRSVSIFEPRPELDHATNALCIVGRRSLTKNVFLDRRAFMNSYYYKNDPEGHYLFQILKAATPVCGDINLAYFFSKTDNNKLGAGSKLPHNVMGLMAVANGSEGDLRPGLPAQMVESHEPLRLLMIVEHYPEVVLSVVLENPPLKEYYCKDWVHLVCLHPENGMVYRLENETMKPYQVLHTSLPEVNDFIPLIENSHPKQHIPVHIKNLKAGIAG